jgi:DNA-binding transcriptional MocR family regulator
MHLWLRLPDSASDADISEAAAAHGLAVTPGRASFPGEPPAPYLRLSYAGEDAPALRRAVSVLAEVLAATAPATVPQTTMPQTTMP